MQGRAWEMQIFWYLLISSFLLVVLFSSLYLRCCLALMYSASGVR